MSGGWIWGKLPAHGDFVARGLSSQRRDELDTWLSASLAEARAVLGDAFEASYGEAPPWRFAWTDTGGWTAGAMAPSMDSVERRYPLLVARDGLMPEQAGLVAEAAEDLLYDALGEGWDADRLHQAVAALPPAAGDAPARQGWWTLGAERFSERRLAGARPEGLMVAALTPQAST